MTTQKDVDGVNDLGLWGPVTEIVSRGPDWVGRLFVTTKYTAKQRAYIEAKLLADQGEDAATDFDEPGIFAAALRAEMPIVDGRATPRDIREYREEVDRRATSAGFDPEIVDEVN
jgi:hypothetical protein